MSLAASGLDIPTLLGKFSENKTFKTSIYEFRVIQEQDVKDCIHLLSYAYGRYDTVHQNQTKLNKFKENEDLPYWLPFVHASMEQKMGVIVLKHTYLIGVAIGFDVTTKDQNLRVSRQQVKKMRRKVNELFDSREAVYKKLYERIEIPEEKYVGCVDFAMAVDDTVFGEGVDILLGKLYRALTIQKGYEWFLGGYTSEPRKTLVTSCHDCQSIISSLPLIEYQNSEGKPFYEGEGNYDVYRGVNADVLRGKISEQPVHVDPPKDPNADSDSESVEILNPEKDDSLSMEE
jgi:hypothetical protein